MIRSKLMGLMKKMTFLAGPVLGAAVYGAPFEPDENTLFLSGFEKSLRTADYAAGASSFLGIGALQGEGYFGKGADLRGRGVSANFEKSSEMGQSPIFNRFALMTYGNLLPDEGTFELWVYIENAPGKRLPNHGQLLNAFVGRFIDDGKSYKGASISISRGTLRFQIPIWSDDSRDHWSDTVKFSKPLKIGWHHLALTWAGGEAVFYLDGRIVSSCNLQGKYGLSIFHHLNHGILLGGHRIDELRISDIARYKGDFEPNWRGNKRPDYAFEGRREAVKRFPATYRKPARQTFDFSESIELGGNVAALSVVESLERTPLPPGKIKWLGRRHFEQVFGKSLTVNGKITSLSAVQGEEVNLTFQNKDSREMWLEVAMLNKFTAPPAKVFDGMEIKDAFSHSFYRDNYVMAMPLFAVADAKGNYQAVAFDPSTPFNDLVSSFSPGKGFGQGVKFVLSPGESFSFKAVSFGGRDLFAIEAAMDNYYKNYASFYHIDRKNTIYHYLPLTMHWRARLPADIQRQGYAGGYWGHGPYHTKGNETGTFWQMDKYVNEPSYKHAAGNERRFQTPENLHEAIAVENRYEFDHGYGVRRYHANPDLTPLWLIREIQPDSSLRDDPLTTGHYYKRIGGQYFVNEYNSKLGKFFLEELKRYYNYGMKDYSTGWINDTIYANSTIRYNDESARKAPGRSFSVDFGPFIRGAMGKQQRWEFISKLKSRGYPMTMIADGGSFSYTIAAYSAQSALESGSVFESLHGWRFLRNARYLHGEKPLSMHTLPEKIETARSADVKDFTPELLRSVYLYNSEYMVLFALEHALFLDPEAYMTGKQYIAEMAPLLVDAVLRGRKSVPAAVSDGGTWMRRSGEKLETLLICGNPASEAKKVKIDIFKRYFEGVPLAAAYFGGKTRLTATPQSVNLTVKIPPRQAAAYLVPAVAGDVSMAETSLTGDGISLKLAVTRENPKKTTLRLSTFAPLYQMYSLSLNGKKCSVSEIPLTLPAGKNRIVARYRIAAFDFDAAVWRETDLFSDNKVNFDLVCEPGYHYKKLYLNMTLGYERGTAGLFEDFVRYYDTEDGILGNLAMPGVFREEQRNNLKWQIVLNGKAVKNKVAIDPEKKLIHIDGTAPGECRRLAVLFLRLMDRKYPHIGTIFPARNNAFDRTRKLERRFFREDRVAKFFQQFPEKDFLHKPLLNREFFHLYGNNTTDFTGKYRMKTPPFLFEPTYGDDFVYGFKEEDPKWRRFFAENPAVEPEK